MRLARPKAWARRLGLARPSPDGAERVHLLEAGPSLVRDGLTTLTLAVLMGAVVVALFDWRLLEVLVGTGIGVAVRGGVHFFSETRDAIPRSGDSLPVASADAEIERRSVLRPSLVLALPVCLALAWLADRWDLGAVFVPGQFAGSAAASLMGAALVHHWQRAHQARVLIRHAGFGETELYRAAIGERRHPGSA